MKVVFHSDDVKLGYFKRSIACKRLCINNIDDKFHHSAFNVV